MKGVLLSLDPRATIVDLDNAIRPQDIRHGAYVLLTAAPHFPFAVHIAVVDPGVGTARKAVILRTPRADFVAPDNGILSYVLQDYDIAVDNENAKIAPGSGLEAVAITSPRFRRSPVSATFHGRDIFAPAAAHLSLGVPLSDFGEALDSLTVFPVPVPRRESDGGLTGHILHIDSFGNLITDIKERDLSGDTASMTATVGGEVIRGLSRTYGSGRGLLALIGSSGRLEISLRDGSAAARLRAEVGDGITVKI